MQARQTSQRRHGFTLVELVTSLAIMTILVGGMGSAVMIASQAIDDGTSRSSRITEAREALDRITADAAVALSVTERTASAIAFTVPDRSGDGLPETLRYAWSGVAGDPLTCEYNGGSPVTIADDVHQFDLTYLLLTKGPPPPPPEQESPEMLLIFHDDAPGGTLQEFVVKPELPCAQYFKPSLPVNTISWSVTRVKAWTMVSGASNNTFLFQLRPADANLKPTTEILEEVQSPESLSGKKDWLCIDLPYSSATGLDPAEGLCLVTAMDGGSAKVCFEQDGSPMTPDTHWMTSGDSGASWSAPNDTQDMRFYVYGTVTTDGPPEWP